ncbi:hypothetical protein HHK36_023475 [Tetracentron sinense]|uniref:non-specific serine/threonine protein kinase n=1 Tax=Tetracentron sinense TaxID=13715 RepID=A0A835D8Q8_TETSI|nr:hypothetical protein HHK36_023475 [Tetracentron sinense]
MKMIADIVIIGQASRMTILLLCQCLILKRYLPVHMVIAGVLINSVINDYLYINCGGDEVTINGSIYEADKQHYGASTIYPMNRTCGLSMVDTALFSTARISLLSLKYYGFCLKNGNYTVRLHFAEIAFTEEKDSHFKGKRVFNVKIQGGLNKEFYEDFPTIVSDNLLEIHFSWSGKGSAYFSQQQGSLISAIAVSPFPKSRKLSGVIIAGIAGSTLFLLGVLPNGAPIAVKQLPNVREFVNEIGTIAALQHPNLVKLLGCCTEDNQLLIVGYMAPEYAMRGYLTNKADVYSFGVVILEIMSGKNSMKYKPNEESFYLLDLVLQQKGNLIALVDSTLGYNYLMKEALNILELAMLCTNPSPTLRPVMSEVVRILEGKTQMKAPPLHAPYSMDDFVRAKAMADIPLSTQSCGTFGEGT